MGLAQRKLYYGGNELMNEKERLYTIADIEALPEGERAELLDGKMYMMAAPTATHQRLLGFLFFEFQSFIKRNNGDCEVFLSPFAVYLNETNDYVEPDLIIVCGKDKVDEKGCHGAPDFVIEIVSSSSRTMDYVRKLHKFRACGVREYWIVDPEKNRILVYVLAEENECVREYSFSDKVSVGIYEGKLEIDFAEF